MNFEMNIGMTISQSLQLNDLHISELRSQTSYSFGSTSQPCTLSSGHQTTEITQRFIVWGNDSARITSCRISSETRRGQFIASGGKTNQRLMQCVLDPCSEKQKNWSNKSPKCPTEAIAYWRSRCWDSKTRPKITTSASIRTIPQLRFVAYPLGTAQPS